METKVIRTADVDVERYKKAAAAIASRDNCDIFLYNGEIQRRSDLDFILTIHANRKHDGCKLLLITHGGDPDAAYKMARYLQEKYKAFELLLAGMCKSAGTLLATGAHGLIFSPYGEMGPLDVQLIKEDKVTGMHSGLNISEALAAMEKATFNTYLRMITNLFRASGGVISFGTATKAAADVVGAMYGPIFAQFDPEDIGNRTRSMRIAADYGKRLDGFTQNMKPDAIKKLAETFSSHSFVIDFREARALFKNVREADQLELELISALGECARWPVSTPKSEPLIECLSAPEGEGDAATQLQTDRPGPDGPDRAAARRAGAKAGAKARRTRRGDGRRPSPPNVQLPSGERGGG
jgi:hypothetical protein